MPLAPRASLAASHDVVNVRLSVWKMGTAITGGGGLSRAGSMEKITSPARTPGPDIMVREPALALVAVLVSRFASIPRETYAEQQSAPLLKN